MKPVVICEFFATSDGGGFFANVLAEHGLSVEYVSVARGDKLPAPEDITALAVMGGTMSVNDSLPWMETQLELMRRCDAEGVPLIGHCLGGQLLAKALGGQVKRAPYDEIGFHTVYSTPEAREAGWLDTEDGVVLQWHEDVFEPPPGAVEILQGPREFPHQGFVTPAGSIGLQCHIEVDEAMVRRWTNASPHAFDKPGPAVQPLTEVLTDLAEKCAASHRFARTLYERWIEDIKRRR